MKQPVAILGSGNIGTDLLVKLRRSTVLEPTLLAGIDAQSDGLRRAREAGIETVLNGADGLMAHPRFKDITVIFDATSARAHLAHAPALEAAGKTLIDLTPTARGPEVVPVANLHQHREARNVNMITCGGQATIPIVWAVARAAAVEYAEVISAVASKSAGPGTRANIDEFTRTTARGLESIGGARRGKAIIILNPAEPPIIMRNTVYALCIAKPQDEAAIRASIEDVVRQVQGYVPGYRLAQEPVFDTVSDVFMPGHGTFSGLKVTVLLQVEGAGDYLPPYAGNLDIMTSAALRMGEALAVGGALV